MAAEDVQLIIDFIISNDAVGFADAFGGLVLSRTTPAVVDTIDAEGSRRKRSRTQASEARQFPGVGPSR